MRISNWTIAYAVVVSILLFAAGYESEKTRRENCRLKANQQMLLTPQTVVEYRNTSDGKAVAEVQALNLKISELKACNDSLLRLAGDLGIKTRRLMALAQTTAKTQTDIHTGIKDSILPGSTDTLPCVSYVDPWISFSGCIKADTFTGRIESRDTLDFIVHRIPKRFLFFRFGCKAIRMDAVSHNPHSILTHAKYIRITE